MIQTWIADVTPLLKQEVYEKYYDQLPQWRKEKADRLRDTLGRAQSVGAWILLQRMCKYYGVLETTGFNLSHSGSYALCSVVVPDQKTEEDTAVGCDVELVGEFRRKVVERFFSKTEQEHIFSQKEEDTQRDLFYRYWVLKESFVKATGRGLGIDLRSFEIRFVEDQPILTRQPKEYPRPYFYREYVYSKANIKIAVCSTDSRFGELRDEQL